MTYPVLIGEAVQSAIDGRDRFPFRSWAARARFEYPSEATDFLSHCGSAAEAWFAREFVNGPSIVYDASNRAVRSDGLTLTLQAAASRYRIDAVVESSAAKLAIEIDGMQWHSRTNEQVAADYIRERRLVLVGYTVIRFTSPEIFGNVNECWRQVEAILERRGRA